MLWDPSFSGRRFLRRQRTLSDLVVAPEAAGSNPVLSTTLHPDAAEWIGEQRVDADDPRRDRRCRRSCSPAAAPATSPTSAAGVDVAIVDGQEELLDVSSSVAAIPVDTIAAIADWVAGALPGTRARCA